MPYPLLYEDEREALWLMIKGCTIDEIAEQLNLKFGLTYRQSKRRVDNVNVKLGASKATEAVAKAIALGIVPLEDVMRYYEIPTYQFKERESLSGVVRKNHGNGYLPLLPEVDVSNPHEVNSWLSEVATRTHRTPQWEPERLNAYFSQIFTKARNYSTPYAPHPLALNTQVILPVDGNYPSLSMEYDRAFLTEGYLSKAPRLLFMGHLPIETLTEQISTEIAKPIIAQGDVRADLACKFLKHRPQFKEGFHHLVKRWYSLNIFPMSAIAGLVRNGKKPKDDWLQNLGADSLSPDQVEDWLRNLVGQLAWYDETFHVALLDDITYQNNVLAQYINSDFWAVKVSIKGENAMFWEEWAVDSQGRRREVDRRVTEVGIINALIEIFGYIWKFMPNEILIRDKEAVIKYLRDQCNNLKPRFGN